MFGAVRLFLVAAVVALIAIGGSGNARAAAVDVRATVAAVAGLTPRAAKW
jgi:hypothetical protein